jgi:hypothetical protein
MIELTAGADVQRGKQNIVVDLTTDAGQQRLAELVAQTDVVVCNMRPGPASRLNVDADSIHTLRPDALYCRISAFPESDWPGYDPLVQQASGVVEAYTRESRSGIGNWLGLAGSIDYGGGASGLFAIAVGLIAQARGMSAGASVEASLAQFAQLIQSDRIVTGTSLPPIPEAPMPLSLADDGRWQYTPTNSGAEGTSTMPVVTLASLRSNATPVGDQQIGEPCPPGFSATSVIRQEQHGGGSDHHPAPTHVRFEQADDPIIVPPAVLDRSNAGS